MTSEYLRTRFPNTLELRRAARENFGTLKVEPSGREPGTLGAAFDMLTSIVVSPESRHLDPSPSLMWTPRHASVTRMALDIATNPHHLTARTDEFYIAVWTLGLLGNSIRSIRAHLLNPTTEIIRAAGSADSALKSILALAPDVCLAELRQLDAVATKTLFPQLPVDTVFHPYLTVDSIRAEADLIADGLLIDLKSARGDVRATGTTLLPKATDLYQILVYALLCNVEYVEEYGRVDRVGIYAARYGELIEWPLQEFADRLAGKPIDMGKVTETLLAQASMDEFISN